MTVFNSARPNRQVHRSGFTLVEVLTVVTIIVLLAGIVIGSLGAVRKMQAKKETSVRVSMMKKSVEDYASDNDGIYPLETDGTYARNTYKVLSGDLSGVQDKAESNYGEIYWADLLNPKTGLTRRIGPSLVIVDAYQNPMRYRRGTDASGNEVEQARNVDFDVWSTGPDGLPRDENVDSNLENEETVDDIWN